MKTPEHTSVSIKKRNIVLKWVGFFCLWTLLGVFSASQNMLVLQEIGMNPTWEESLRHALIDWYLWALLTIPIGVLVVKVGLDISRWKRIALVQILLSAAFALIHISLLATSQQIESSICGEQASFMGKAIPLFNIRFHWNVLIYLAIIGVIFAREYYRRYRAKEIVSAKLETQLVQAQLQALKMQMNPHFLFNTLNSVAALIRDKQNGVAVDVLTELSDLLRYTLKSESVQVVPLNQELEMLERYLAIERIRFSDHLQISMNIDRQALDAAIPNLILQPLVENSIKHGIQSRERKNHIDVSVGRENGHLKIMVENDGNALPQNWSMDHNGGIGLRNTRIRLEQLYGTAQSFSIENVNGGGVRTTMRIPFEKYS